MVMIVLALCVPTNAGLNWLLIFGHLGLPQLGLVGAGYASAINQWLMLIGLAAAFAALPRDDPARRLRGRLPAVLNDIRRILRLGLPIGGHQAMEIGVFVTSAGLMGLFGADALAAHQIVINCSSVTFMVPLGIGQAATVRIAIARGVGAPIAARRAGFVAMVLGLSFMAAASLALLILPRSIVAAYVAIDDPANLTLVALAVQFMIVAAAFQIVDGMQTVAAGALRGYEDTTVPMLLAALGYWAIGFVGGWALAFPLGLGPIGLWWGFLLGLAAVGLLLALRLWRRSAREIAG
jgi:MATE family multidrug resistance protein